MVVIKLFEEFQKNEGYQCFDINTIVKYKRQKLQDDGISTKIILGQEFHFISGFMLTLLLKLDEPE